MFFGFRLPRFKATNLSIGGAILIYFGSICMCGKRGYWRRTKMRHDLLWLSVSNRSQRGSRRSLRRARKHFVFDGTWRFFFVVVSFSKVRFLRFVNINIVHTLTCVVLVFFSFFSLVIIKLCARKIKVPFIFGFSIKLISFKLKQKKVVFFALWIALKKCFAPFGGVAPTISAGDRTAVFLLSQLWLSAVYIVSVKSFHTRINYWKRKIKLLKKNAKNWI